MMPEEFREIWTDAYKFHAKFEKMGNTPEEWAECARTMGLLSSGHNNHPLAMKLLTAVFDYMDETRKAIAKEEAERRAAIDQPV